MNAPVAICFDLARSIEVHLSSTAHTNEQAVAGRTSRLRETGDTITWRARHFGIYQFLTVEITAMFAPWHFQDRMIKGAFSYFTHDHYFEEQGSGTLMRDVFHYAAPGGPVGRLTEKIFLDKYMQNLLMKRNAFIKAEAERLYRK